jgi:hypothetical protein
MTAQTPRAKLRVVVDIGVEAVLLPARFERARSKLLWRRATDQLDHVIEIRKTRGSYGVQWGVVSPELIWFLWGNEGAGDVSDAAMTGTLASVRRPARPQLFQLTEHSDAELIAARLAEDMGAVEHLLEPFKTRAGLRRYLLENRDPTDRRGFVVPAKLPLKLYVAAALAVVDQAPEATGLVAEATEALSRFDGDITAGRLARLREAAACLADER